MSFGPLVASRLAYEGLEPLNRRRMGGLFRSRPLQWHQGLASLAMQQAKDMAARGVLDHADSMGRSPHERAEDAGLGRFYRGETVAWNYDTAASAVAGWWRSLGHWWILDSNRATHVGIAVAFSADGEPYWCAVTGGGR